MTPTTRLETLRSACPDLHDSVVTDFNSRMDPDYFEQFSMQTIIDHLRLVGNLSHDLPCTTHIHQNHSGLHELVIVAYDYFSEFATICGILSAFGLDIREAFIFTYADRPSQESKNTATKKNPRKDLYWWSIRSPQAHGLSRKKVVDVFRFQVLRGFTFHPEDQQRLNNELIAMFHLLETRHVRDVRIQVNRQLVETFGKIRKSTTDFIHPVQIQFDNTVSPNETVLDIRSTDTPAFLYTFTNALTMRGIYISKAKIEIEGTRVRNRLFVRGRRGGKIESKAEQQELTTAAALIKEFTHFLSQAPDPGKALEHFDQHLDHLLEEHQKVWKSSKHPQKSLMGHLAKLFGSSDFLWEDFIRRQHANVFPIMKEHQKGPLLRSKNALKKELQTRLGKQRSASVRKEELNQFKDRELFRIDIKHLLDGTPLPDFSYALTNLAEVILEQAIVEAQAVINRVHKPPTYRNNRPCPFTICGLGKLGGAELGYASDIEVLCVYDIDQTPQAGKQANTTEYFEQLVQEILRWIEAKQEGIFHIDTRLRPHGDKGLLANTLEEIRRYYDSKGMAAPFERQALIKLRTVAGNAALGRKVEAHRDQFVYSKERWPLDTGLHLRERQIHELIPPETIHVKFSPGALLDIEYTIQYLQLLHGHRRPSLRTPNTLQALDALKKAKLLSTKEAHILREDYVFFRQLIDALRIVRGNARDLVLPQPRSDGMIFLSRRMGFTAEDWQEGARELEQDINRRMVRTHQIFIKKFHVANPDES